jgi:hypothetical protein
MRFLPLPLLRRAAASLLFAGWMAACGPDLLPDPGETPDTETPDEGPQDPILSHVDNGDGTFTTTVNATSDAEWIGLDLDQRRQANGAEDQQWDLAFQRYHIRVRGGVNGTGSVEAVVLSGADFAQVIQAPAAGYATDATESPVFEGADAWYNYDPSSHKLSPRDRVYVVRTDEGAFFKVKILAYYDAAGTPAMFQLRWGLVQPPSSGKRGPPP